MPDRSDDIFNSFATHPQAFAAIPGVTDADEATHTGHYATAAELLHSPELEAFRDDDPVFSEPERFLAGYLAPHDVVGMPLPLPAPVSSWTLASAATVILGFSFIPSAAVTVRLYDGRDGTGRAALQVPVPAVGLTLLFGRLLFPHGLHLEVTGGTVDGGFLIERRVDSIPK